MAITKRTDFENDAQIALTDQFRKEKVKAFASVFSAQVQPIEDVCFQILEGRGIATAIGVQLDGLGALVGESRQGRGDTDYRLWIRARIKLNLSNGTPEEIYTMFALLVQVGQVQQITEYQPAAFLLDLSNATVPATAAQLNTVLQLAKAAGVRAQLITSAVDDANSFIFSDTTETVSVAQGLADTDENGAGGVLAEILG